MTMQMSRRRHVSSGELDVFGATSYFAGGLPDYCRRPSSGPAGRRLMMIQLQADNNQQVTDGSMRMEDEQLVGLHGDLGHTHQLLGVAKPSGNSKLAALLRIFMASPSQQRASSFRNKEPPPPSPPRTVKLPAAAGDEPAKASSSSSSSSSRELQVIDLGVATGDRRLQGVRAVVSGSGHGERWVVRCGGAWEEEHRHERVLDDAESSGDPKDDEVGEGEDGSKKPAGDWESDSSSDLFDLDLEYIC
ncbi:uncharacterized protein C2845_PM01G17980 [Panicum miliaceum]|uniref:Uncharacterized protein n=1 Tax=Panicum miliaceum TaxID=4540 RepID=A0A3L6TJI1_PANMI|nr:uncharacterized protein C2845_PM01G17980 [Panicum miliaceum]